MKNWKKIFTIIWTGQIFSTLSSSIVGYAVIFWLSIQTGSAEVLAFTAIANLLPQAVLGLFTGVFVDRWDRKRTMILADSFVALCSGILAALFLMEDVEMSHVYILLALRSCGSAFHVPAMQASVPLLAPKDALMRIAGVNQIIQSGSSIAGPALAALLIAFMDMSAVLMLDVLGAAIACISLIFVHIPRPKRTEAESGTYIYHEILTGIKAIFKNKGLSYLFSIDVIATFVLIPVSILFPLITLNHFMGDTYQMSIVEIAWGVGMLIGGGILGIKWVVRQNKVILINIMYLILGFSFLLSGILPQDGYILFLILTFFGGISGAIYSGAFTVVLQTKIDPAVLGRVFSIYGSLTLLPAIPGMLATGYIAEHVGLLNAFIIGGAVIILCGVISFCIPELYRLGKTTK